MSSQEAVHVSLMEVMPTSGKGTLGTWWFHFQRGGRTQSRHQPTHELEISYEQTIRSRGVCAPALKPRGEWEGKSEGFALDALSPLWTRDRAGGTAPRRLRASPMPKVQTGIHSWQAERPTGTWIPVESGITGLTWITAVDLASHPP